MAGGIRAWQGLVAAGGPEAGMAYFPSGATAVEIIALAWRLESGSRSFYKGLGSVLTDDKATPLFESLSNAEEHHMDILLDLFRQFKGGAALPGSISPVSDEIEVMEGGMDVGQALGWARGRQLPEVLELATALEVNAHDLYLKMLRAVGSSEARRIFDALAEEEKNHLDLLSVHLEEALG